MYLSIGLVPNNEPFFFILNTLPLTQKESANLRAILAKNGPQKTGFWALAPNPQRKSALAII